MFDKNEGTIMYRNSKVVRKIQALYFKGKTSINGILGLPIQTSEEIRIFKTVFDNFMDKRKIKIFEWGSGFSTIYYSEYLRKKGAAFEWHSIDNNKAWYEKVESKMKKKGLQPYVQLYLKEFMPFWEKPGWETIPPPCGIFSPKSENEKTYINFPLLLNDKFDIVIVDARFRRHCIQTAKEVLLPGGIVIMHDAQKAHYHIGLEDFQYSKFFHSGKWYPFQKIPNQVWAGSIENNKIFEALQRS